MTGIKTTQFGTNKPSKDKMHLKLKWESRNMKKKLLGWNKIFKEKWRMRSEKSSMKTSEEYLQLKISFLILEIKHFRIGIWLKYLLSFQKKCIFSVSNFTLAELINNGILEVKDKVSEISAIASGEYAISQTLEKIKKIWGSIEFIVVNYQDIKDKFILGTIEEIMIRLEDDQVSIQTMLGSKNVHEIRADIEE